MKPGDEIVIGDVVRGVVRAIRSHEELAEIAPLLSVRVDRRLRAEGVIRIALVVVPCDRLPWVLIETAAGWRTWVGEAISVVLLSEARPC
jgi:hypothetical protein